MSSSNDDVLTLQATGISRRFAGVQALSDVSLSIAAGQVLGLIGPNGAGKSTLVNILSGFDRPDRGSVHLGTEDITALSPARRGRRGVARTFQHGHAFEALTVRENVAVAALGVGRSPADAEQAASELLELVGLAHRAGELGSALPHGDERLLGVARALAISPTFVLMDEPAAGLNDLEADAFQSVVRQVVDEQGVGIVLIDHNVELVLAVSDSIHVLDQGATLLEGDPSAVRSDAGVAAAYLGADS